MSNIGKVFETEIKNSIPDDCFYYRLRDSAGAWSGSSNKTRFTTSNICDCLVMSKSTLFLLELKNTMSASLSISNIKANQLKGLSEVNHSNIETYFLVCFREKERMFAACAKELKKFISTTDRKSIPLSWFEDNAIEIPMIKKRTRYIYDLNVLFDKQRRS